MSLFRHLSHRAGACLQRWPCGEWQYATTVNVADLCGHALRHEPESIVLYVVPDQRAAQEQVARLRSIVPRTESVEVRPVSSPDAFDRLGSEQGVVGVLTPSALLGPDGQVIAKHLLKTSLIVLDDLHLLDARYELAIARLLSLGRAARTRFVGLTCTLNDPSDLATWLGVDEFNSFVFSPADRANPVSLSIKSFAIAHSSTLLRTMIKPAYDILKSSPEGAIVFLPSRAACRHAAADLVTQSGNEMDLAGFLGPRTSREEVEPLLFRLRDQALLEPILHGVGYILPGMAPHDLALVLELFAAKIIRALLIPRESCWTLPVRAPTVVLMSAQYINSGGSDRHVVNYSRSELVRMQGLAVTSAAPDAPAGRMFIMCQAEQTASILRVLNDGLPLESALPDVIAQGPTGGDSPAAAAALGAILKDRPAPPRPQIHRPQAKVPVDPRKRDLVDLLGGWTYLALRAKSNPTYYDMQRDAEAEGVSRLVDKWFKDNEFAPAAAHANGASAKRASPKAGTPNGAQGESGVDEDGGKEVAAEVLVGSPAPVGDKDGETVDKA